MNEKKKGKFIFVPNSSHSMVQVVCLHNHIIKDRWPFIRYAVWPYLSGNLTGKTACYTRPRSGGATVSHGTVAKSKLYT